MTIIITDDRNAIDIKKLQSFLKTTIWQAGIGPQTLQRALENSICISAFFNDQQVGFTRAVSDHATFCWLDDVFVDSEFRGQGIADKMLKAVVGHPELSSVSSWFLASSNPVARRVFSRYGFEPLASQRADKLMARPKQYNEDYNC